MKAAVTNDVTSHSRCLFLVPSAGRPWRHLSLNDFAVARNGDCRLYFGGLCTRLAKQNFHWCPQSPTVLYIHIIYGTYDDNNTSESLVMRRTKVYQKYTKFNSMCIHRYVIIGSGKFLRSNARCVVPFSTPTAATITNNLNTHPHSVSHFTSTNIEPHKAPSPSTTLSINEALLLCLLFFVSRLLDEISALFSGCFSLCPRDNSSPVTPPFSDTNSM